MQTRTRTLSILSAGALALAGWTALSSLQDAKPPAAKPQDTKPPAAAAKPQDGKSAAHAMEAAMPTEHHAVLKKIAGTWNAAIDHGGEKSTGTYTIKLGMNDLWALGDFESSMAGSPFHGHSIDGYDTAKGKFVSIWVDSMTSSPMTLEGTYDEKTSTITYVGKGKDMATGKDVEQTHKVTIKSADAMTFEMIAPGEGGQKTTVMTINYTRKK
jgi:hypothetical protein